MAIVLALLIGVWLFTVMIGSQAYSVGEQPQTIQTSQTQSETDELTKTTGRKPSFKRTPVYG